MKVAIIFTAAGLLLVYLVVAVPLQTECSPGQKKEDPCSTCICAEEGYWECNYTCFKQKTSKPCKPGTMLSDGCTTCTCNPDGTTATCTMSDCSSQLPGEVCPDCEQKP
ncbi:serine protease inhibitor I/II-like [Schistocerca serialis cubense]|uniref:serine protease inhibitor I/II-like n=1 Tax=Schistocerca serialis cubense TaxID=2023355 RepID=UPI00214E1B9E|nr:serine protease inhibitor I/II-like [Schistocerca serialis cubense]